MKFFRIFLKEIFFEGFPIERKEFSNILFDRIYVREGKHDTENVFIMHGMGISQRGCKFIFSDGFWCLLKFYGNFLRNFRVY